MTGREEAEFAIQFQKLKAIKKERRNALTEEEWSEFCHLSYGALRDAKTSNQTKRRKYAFKRKWIDFLGDAVRIVETLKDTGEVGTDNREGGSGLDRNGPCPEEN